MSDEKRLLFIEAAKPLMKFLADHVHPHHHVIVTSVDAELMESEMVFGSDEFLDPND